MFLQIIEVAFNNLPTKFRICICRADSNSNGPTLSHFIKTACGSTPEVSDVVAFELR
jgi:hypothetical protein